MDINVAIVNILFYLISINDVDLTRSETDWLYLAQIMAEQTSDIQEPAEKLRIMTDWLHVNVKHVSGGRYPRCFDRTSVVTIVQSGVGNCGYQSYNIVGFAQILGYKNHRILHHRKDWGAPADHTFAEIEVEGKWIIFDPDNFQYFSDDRGQLLGVSDLAKDSTSWVGQSVKNQGFKETKSSKNVQKEFDYEPYEKWGMRYINLVGKMRKANKISPNSKSH